MTYILIYDGSGRQWGYMTQLSFADALYWFDPLAEKGTT